MITILGPTATGKTRLAALTAYKLNGEIISADSRQVFKNMNIGTGKDYDDYNVKGEIIKSHIVDIEEAGAEYSVHQFVKDFNIAYNLIIKKNKLPILCGGTGLYIEAVLKAYNLPEVPENKILRNDLKNKTLEELILILKKLKINHNTTDFTDKERTIRAIEIEVFKNENNTETNKKINSKVFGITGNRELIKERITLRLKQRLQQGLIEEVENLLSKGVTHEKLLFYGLEYRYISLFLQNKITYNEMFNKLNIAIHQFSKRQMTWFRRMEKNGIKINWLNIEWQQEQKIDYIIQNYLK
jgi:tRNA dimethylallyltransferase